MLTTALEKLILKQDLSTNMCEEVIHQILNKESDPMQIAAFLALMRAKPETAAELTSITKSLKQHMISIPTHHRVLDIVGTGGDGANTINISTGSAILAASCGIKIAKHGNRAVTSLAGSADVLEALGIKIDLPKEQIAACIDKIGIGFCFAPHYNPGFLRLRSIRKQLQIGTMLNLLAPLMNPAHASHLLLGVYDKNLLPIIANVLQQTGTQKSMIVHGNGLDEISCAGPAKIIEITTNNIKHTNLNPVDFGFPLCSLNDLKGGDASANAKILISTFSGKRGAIANTLILNAATALYLYGKCSSIADAIPFVQDTLYSGSTLRTLKLWREFSND